MLYWDMHTKFQDHKKLVMWNSILEEIFKGRRYFQHKKYKKMLESVVRTLNETLDRDDQSEIIRVGELLEETFFLRKKDKRIG